MWGLSIAAAVIRARWSCPPSGSTAPSCSPPPSAGGPTGSSPSSAVTGSVIGLLAAGWLSERVGRARPGAGGAGGRSPAHGRAGAGRLPRDRPPRARGPQPGGPPRPDGGDPERRPGTGRLTAVPATAPLRRALRATVAALLAVGALAACSGERPELRRRDQHHHHEHHRGADHHHDGAGAAVAEVAQAKEKSIDVYADAGRRRPPSARSCPASTPPSTRSRSCSSSRATARDGDDRVEVYLPVRPNGSTGWVEHRRRVDHRRPLPDRGGHHRAPHPGVPRRRGHPRRARRRRPHRPAHPRRHLLPQGAAAAAEPRRRLRHLRLRAVRLLQRARRASTAARA